MLEPILIIIIVALVIFLIFIFILGGHYKKKDSNENSAEEDVVYADVAIPDPNHTNDYRFFEFIEEAPLDVISSLVMKIKNRKLLVKDEFRKALEEKADTGEFKNPYTFKDFFGTQFDQIGIHLTKAFDGEESCFQITTYFIQNNAIAYHESINFSPTSEIANNEKFEQLIKSNKLDYSDIVSRNFNEIWDEKSYKEYLTQNLIVCWDDDINSLETVLKSNKITDYKIRYIKLVEIIKSFNMPTDLERFLSQVKTDLGPDSDLALINTSFLNDFKNSGVDIEKFTHTLESKA